MAISAPAASIIDWHSGVTLWQKGPNETRSIASLTKMMTALVWLDASVEQSKKISINSDDFEPSGKYIVQTGDEILVSDLLNLTLVASDNTAANALARSTGWSREQFIGRMNDKAQQLGMIQTQFVDVNGLRNQNVSTVSDIVILSKNFFSKKIFQDITQQKEYLLQRLNNKKKLITVKNTNTLLNSYLKVDGGKTGFIEEAGGCLSVLLENEKGNKILIVVLGSTGQLNRFQEAKALAYWAFKNYQWTNN
ncbi:MAG: hypothetical protein CO133_01565 [Candidatus Komeilibacteria bacterium CG_4_9_14_3_um_filter_37_5]|nr:MAG: hypothetical protein CO133_01565 [Candidatus Komeilibacteria bacterium CG_4_9_14_3_um_filter_37_5]